MPLSEPTPNTFPYALPFIRWADYSTVQRRFPMHTRRLYDHEFVYVTGGSGQIVLDGKPYAATPDTLFLILPAVPHFFQANESLTLLGVHFDWIPQHDTLSFPVFRPADDPVETKLFRASRPVPGWNLVVQPTLDLRARPAVRQLLEEVVTAFARPDEVARLQAGALLAAATMQMTREARLALLSVQSANVGADAVQRVERARILLETPRDVPLTMDKVALHVGWSGDHLRRMFRAVLNQSPNRIQTAARMAHARSLLREPTRRSIADVAALCGFEDAAHFARVFKKECGLTPREFLILAKRY